MMGARATLNIRGKTGDASNLASLSDEVLNSLNVRGNGRIGICQDGESAYLKWINHDRFNPVRVYRTRMAQERFGETTGRLTGPVRFVRKLMDSWRLDCADVVGLLGCHREDLKYVSDILNGRRQLRGRDVRDRIAHLFIIRKTLWSLFRNLDVENDWLREGHSLLNGKTPMSLIIGGSMEDLLLVREYVESAAGVR